VAHYKPWRARIGRQQVLLKARVAKEPEQTFRGEKTLWAALEEKPVFLLGGDHPARARRGFEQSYVNAKLLQAERTGEAADAASDND
jgi:hypothetical protein